MSIHYRLITVNATPPTSPQRGTIWIKPIGDPDTYQGYMWLGAWKPFLSGGTYITETGDDHYINVIIQEATPTDIIKPGWIWIKDSLNQAYLYIFDFMPLVGA